MATLRGAQEGAGMAGRLAEKVAIVTGAGARGPGVGNGMATAILFAREGARVLCVDQVPERAQATCDTILAEGGTASTYAADVTRKAQCEAMVAAAVERYGRLDVLHNNVGITMRRDVRVITEEEWDRALTVNLKSMLLTVQAALPALEAAGGGAIVNVTLFAGLIPAAPSQAFGALLLVVRKEADELVHQYALVGDLHPRRVLQHQLVQLLLGLVQVQVARGRYLGHRHPSGLRRGQRQDALL